MTDGPIFSQRACGVAPLRYARTRCGETGCGAVAVYNALWLLGAHPSLASVIHRMECSRCPAWGGRLGTGPRSLSRVLRIFGADFRRTQKLSALAGSLAEGDIAILAIWNDAADVRRGAHFFTVQRTLTGFVAYNREASPCAGTPEEIVGRGRLITAYCITGQKSLA